MSQTLSRAAETTPPWTPKATAQASTGPPTQVAVTGMAPSATLCECCRNTVDSRAAAVTARSAVSSAGVRRDGSEYTTELTAVQAVMAASTAHASSSLEYSAWFTARSAA